jgi:plastocyanin
MRVPLAGLAVLLLMSPAYAAAPRTQVVVIDKMKFGPVPASVRPGDTIIWVNKDMFRHTATARNGSFNVDLPPNSRGKTLIRAKGAFAFYCKYHPAMTGTLKVSN